MKRHSYLPLLCVLFAGCGAPSAQEQPATETKPATPAEAPATAPEPTKTYKVKKAADIELGPGAPPATVEKYRAAMEKAAVEPPPLDTKIADKVLVVLNTSRGAVTVELDSKAAPLHVRSFVYLAEKGFFNNTKFHRHADLSGDGKGFIIQGGDPLSKAPATASFAGMGGPGYEIPREFNALKHDKLVIAAARSNDPDSAGSQFYITQGPVNFLDEGYTVFGKVVEGAGFALRLRQNDVIKTAELKK
ncbi:MAG TPA: peptidylprolyl isomerase [Abditibacterium sp.]